jgi:hypothetical protein
VEANSGFRRTHGSGHFAVTIRTSVSSLSASLMDYGLPKADNVRDFAVATTVTPCAHNLLGVEGCDMLSDLHASTEYRAHLVQVMAKRAVQGAGG